MKVGPPGGPRIRGHGSPSRRYGADAIDGRAAAATIAIGIYAGERGATAAALADSFPASDPIAVCIDDGTAPRAEAGEERG